MKKIFLIPLLTLMCSVMAWSATVEVGTFAELKSAINSASDGDVIKLTGDITGSTSNSSANVLNITKSITIDGQGNTLKNCGNYSVFRVNQGVASPQFVTITIKDLKMVQPEGDDYGIASNSSLGQLTLENCDITCAAGGNPHGLLIGGPAPEGGSKLIIKNTHINATVSGYPIRVFSPMDITMEGSQTEGYCGVYFARKENGYSGSQGPRGSIMYAKRCNFDAPNVHSGNTNAFAVFPLEDSDMTFTLENCGMNGEMYGDQGQSLFCLSEWTLDERRGVGSINITLSGDNSHFNVSSEVLSNDYIWKNSGSPEYGPKSENYYKEMAAEDAVDVSASFTIAGGTYSVNPTNLIFKNKSYKTKEGDEWVSHYEAVPFTIPETHEVQTINQGGVTLYRVVKKAATKVDPETQEEVLYDLNDKVEGEGVAEGNNPVSSFELSTGEEMTLNQETTTAGYVQVQDNVTVNPDTQEEVVTPTTVQVGKTEVNPETEEKEKVDQTLVINNGLDVQGDSKVEVQAGSALVIGEGGINTEKPENIVIEADEQGAASLLLEPSITVNQTPELTVKMTVPAEHAGYEVFGGDKYRHWFRFAVPVKDADSWTKEPNVPTYLYGWDYNEQEWAQVSVAEMIPFYGYTLSPDQEIDGTTAVTYTFKGKLMGNTDCKLELNHHGYNFFGNSYTGYISILKLVEQIMGDAKIDGTVWMWDGEKYQGVALAGLSDRPYLYDDWQKEVAPMQTFVLRLTGAEFSSTDINYADAIWGNPRYTSAVANAAPARKAEMNDNAIIRMTIAANGQKESVLFIENNDYSDEYDRGYDAIKYMNGNSFNSYVSVNGENYGTVATDNIEGKMLDIRTSDAYAYSMTFDFVAGEEYALLDNATNQVIEIEEGNTYEFAAQPNSTVEGRFEIISRAKMPTAIENTEVKADVKGIYTIMGQYLGENFEALPAGVYVVNGVKIVK